MSYQRVLPRDFYNESKLLKCMGRLDLLRHDELLPVGIKIVINGNGEPFQIEKDESSGDIYIANYKTTVNGQAVRFEANLNSTSPYPLVCMTLDDLTPYVVFDDTGELDSEFIEAFQKTQP